MKRPSSMIVALLSLLVLSLVPMRQGRAAPYPPSLWPVLSGSITSDFGYRHSPFRKRSWRFHRGIDIAALRGAPIMATADGLVIYAGTRGGYGRTVILYHGLGLCTVYGHASRLLVRKGEWVQRGAVIALVGSSGRSTGPHLHYEVETDGRPTDPMKYILREEI